MSTFLIDSALTMTNECGDNAKCSIHTPCILCNDKGRINVRMVLKRLFLSFCLFVFTEILCLGSSITRNIKFFNWKIN
jgi:hypothetical protein